MYTYWAKVDRVVDGDTVDLIVDLGFSVGINVRVRMQGYDAPEQRTRNLTEKARGLEATAYLENLLSKAKGGWIIFESAIYERDKYGRSVGKLFIFTDELTEQLDINQAMIDAGHIK